MERSAGISECGRYRNWLRRSWAPGPTCVFIMLNPSTADGTKDDPTCRRCIHFAVRECCGSLLIVNLYAWRSSSPADLFKLPYDEAVGDPSAWAMELQAEERLGPVIAAWGGDRRAERRARIVALELSVLDVPLLCLGTTKAGAPKHPLYLGGFTPLVPYEPEYA